MNTNDTSDRRTCAITGAGGYLGSAATRKFQREGWNVRPLTRSAKNENAVPFQLGDEVAPDLLRSCDALVHGAYDFSEISRDEIWRVNVNGAKILFESARKAGVGRLVCISSISAFEGCKSLYGRAKLEIEKIARDHGALIIRPGLIYGDSPQGMFGKLSEQIEKSKIIPLIGDGSQIQYLVHEDDLCDFIFRVCAGKFPLPATPVTAAHEQGWTFQKILEAIAKQKGRKPLFVPLPWRLMWAAFKTAEVLHLPSNFRSDSIISLINQNPSPDFSHNREAGLFCRPFTV